MGRPSSIGWVWDDERTLALVERIEAGDTAAEAARSLSVRFDCPAFNSENGKTAVQKAVRGKEGKARLARLLSKERFEAIQEMFGRDGSRRGGLKGGPAGKGRPRTVTPAVLQAREARKARARTPKAMHEREERSARAREAQSAARKAERLARQVRQQQLEAARIKAAFAALHTRPRVFFCRLPLGEKGGHYVCGKKCDRPFCDEHLEQGLRWHAQVLLAMRKDRICKVPA